jgi:hypothetical protein
LSSSIPVPASALTRTKGAVSRNVPRQERTSSSTSDRKSVRLVDLVITDPRQAQELHDGDMLAGLDVRPLVARDDEEDDVDRRRPRDHVLDEPLVARHIDDPDLSPVLEGERGEAEVYCHLPLFFLLEAVGVDARERLDERALAVVDVPGRSHDDVVDVGRFELGWGHVSLRRRAPDSGQV